jgi:hypothetical protein
MDIAGQVFLSFSSTDPPFLNAHATRANDWSLKTGISAVDRKPGTKSKAK